MTNFVDRKADEIALPLIRGASILHPEHAIIRFRDHSSTIDVGARCFVRRAKATTRIRQRKPLQVDPQSLDKQRRRAVRRLISLLSAEVEASGKRMASLHQQTNTFLRFIDWADANSHQGVLNTERHARAALAAFVEYLRDRVDRNDLSVNTAYDSQYNAIYWLGEILCVDNIAQGIRLLQSSTNAMEATPPPSEEDQSRLLALAEMLFTGISTLVLDRKAFPYKMPVPDYLHWQDRHLYLFPNAKPFMAPHEIAVRGRQKGSFWAVDYVHGRVANLNEIEHRYSTRDKAVRAVTVVASAISDANQDPQHYRRRQLAMVAHNAFVHLFEANTAMNWAQVRALPWNPKYELTVERQHFRTIKYRAADRTVSFTIHATFLPQFRRFVALRNYLLDQATCEYLFIALGANLVGPPRQMGAGVLIDTCKTLRRIDPTSPKVLARAWRAAKSDWVIRRSDTATAAIVLQTSEDSIARSYAAGSVGQMEDEMGMYFARLSEIVQNPSTSRQNSHSAGALTHCKQLDNPHPIGKRVPVEPDCGQPEGCLFCDKLSVHADERDVRKLLSCRYCINMTAELSHSMAHFQELFGPVIDRINAIVSEIRNVSVMHTEMVERVRREVDEEGSLDSYWEHKLELLVSLGVISS